LSAARALATARTRYRNPPRLRRTASGRSFSYNLRFPGQYYMAETGLNQNWNRDYDPVVGRYVESDPIGVKGGVNTYAYVRSNPLSSPDPWGLCDISMRCGTVFRLGLPVGTHCGVIAPNGVEFGLSGGDESGGTSGTAHPYTHAPGSPSAGQTDFKVTCPCKSCNDVQGCMQDFNNSITWWPYITTGPNSNTYAHKMLSRCGCTASSVPSTAWGW
jgi:RHS repeat-associated protein